MKPRLDCETGLSPATLMGRRFDYGITLYGKAREVCPEFGDHSRRVRWSISDPAIAGPAEQSGHAAFSRAAADIDTRIRYLLPVLTQTPETHP
jgi:ArsR family transcriptional regulator, arsenate/arsenite/antimonite-responsive transcriptional repressor / arsenate reductase (thioredoxin)